MTDQLHITQQSDDEEEDLERLRLEALKTIHNKKENLTPQILAYHRSPIQSRPISSHPYITQSHITPVNTYPTNTLPADINHKIYYPPVIPHSNHNLPSTIRPITNLNSYGSRQRLEKLEINEPYVPQHVPPINLNVGGLNSIPIPVSETWIAEPMTAGVMGNGYAPYVPHKVTDNIGVGNVQLSPRSMAFVAENNDILMRRKGEKPSYDRSSRDRSFSPGYRSPSPIYRSSLGRWSHSPSLRSKSRSPVSRSRQHSSYAHRRSPSSRSPPSTTRSPIFRRKTLSKSPPRVTRLTSPSSSYRYQSKSPPSGSSRRGKSRSPLPHLSRHKVSPAHRISRSPNPSGRYTRPSSRSPPPNVNNGRRRSPQGFPRYANRSRGNSPSNSKRSPVYSRTIDATDSTVKHTNRRSRTPINQPANNHMHKKSISPRPRSRSRSPVRKYQRRSKERNTQFNRRRSPYDRNVRKRNDGGPMNGFKNRNRKRSCSPTNIKRKRSRTKSPERIRKDDNRFKKFDRDRRRPEEYNGRNERWDDRGKNSENKYKNSQTSATRKDGRGNSVERKRDGVDFRERKTGRQDDKLYNKNDKRDRSQRRNSKSKEEDASGDPSLTPIKEINMESEENKEKVEKSNKISNDDIQTKDNDDKVNSEQDDDNDNDDEESSNEDDDGIDLFASDESESENEGRFKLSSSKNERNAQVTTLSFSKLGETSIPVKDLQEITSTNRSGSHSSDFDNNRRRGNDRFKNKSSDMGKNDRRRNDRDRRERDDNSYKEEEKRNENKPMFKSTFTVVENEAVKSNGKLAFDKETNDKKSTMQLKKKLPMKLNKESPETEIKTPSSDKLTSTVNTSTASSSSVLASSSNSTSGGKKPIHLRLGAMTNTFKTPKKSSNWASSSSEKEF